MEAREPRRPRRRSRPSQPEAPAGADARTLRWWFAGVVVVAALPRLLTAGRFVTVDEPTWILRSVRFSDALMQLDLASASASLGEPATMPGSPTMWIGTFSRMVWSLGRSLGAVDANTFYATDGLAITQYATALVTSVLVGVLFAVVARWVGLVPALIAAVLVATEPWLVALGAVVHTDELTALFGTIGLVGLAWALGIPDPARRPLRDRWVAGHTGMALMASALTKVTGAGYWSGAAAVGGWALVRHRRQGGGWYDAASPLRLCAVAAVAGVGLVPIAWPAVVVDPVFQVERLFAAAGLAGDSEVAGGSSQFFLGARTNHPGILYYPIALALRVTPWFLISLLVTLPVAITRADTRRHALVFVAPLAGLFVVLAASAKTYDRYGLVLLVPSAVIIGLGVDRIRRGLDLAEATAVRGLAVAAVAAVAYSLSVAPWGLAYFDAALGGSRQAEETLLVGWGEGLEVAAARIEELEGGDCRGTTVRGLELLNLVAWPCTTPSARRSEYVVLYINAMQRSPVPRASVAGRELVEVIEIRGIPYAEIWE